MNEWQPIKFAPRDGSSFLGWSVDYGMRETRMGKYIEGSIGFANWQNGDGPLNTGWDWDEPKANSAHTWFPTHWTPLPTLPQGVSTDE